VSSVESCVLPHNALLARYAGDGNYVDCYASDIGAAISHVDYVFAFYTTPLFKLERAILRWAVSKPSTDAQAKRLAEGETDRFAAWFVESRSENQILLADYRGRTRSWLMSEPLLGGGAPGTRLYFGSAVIAVRHAKSAKPSLGPAFRALLAFHKIYSKALLYSAQSRLTRQ
jgi:hypothetical protein